MRGDSYTIEDVPVRVQAGRVQTDLVGSSGRAGS